MIAIKYGIFAVISTLLNLFFQYLAFTVYSGFLSLYLAMAAGTIAGLLSKYVLDKKYIFYHNPRSRGEDAKKFVLYSVTGVFTTGVFWGTEIFFDWAFASAGAKYIGAVVGLGVGYVCKYHLDKRLVFRQQAKVVNPTVR